MTKITAKRFIEKANLIHNNFYDYSQVEYVNMRTKVKIICPVHGSFEQLPNNHLNSQGCPMCANKSRNNWHVKNLKQFIEKANLIHNNFYNYSQVEFTTLKSKVKIICPVHGIFEQSANNHLNGSGCPECKKEKLKKKHSKTTEEFVEKANLIHNNFYNYSLTNYINNKTKVKIICPIHGIFEQTPHNHLHKQGCPFCSSSHGENEIRNYLKNKNIEFFTEFFFDDLIGDFKPLRFDFYLPNENLLIEYNGKQHYEAIKHFGGEEQLKKQKKYDSLKENYAKSNNYNFLVISYNDNIAERLDKFLLL